MKRKSKSEETLDPEVAKLFENESDLEEMTYRERLERRQKNKGFVMPIKRTQVSDSEWELDDQERDLTVITSNDELEDIPSPNEIIIEADKLENTRKNQESRASGASGSVVMINDGIEDIDHLMESTGYAPPASMPLIFEEFGKRCGGFESRILNRASTSVLMSAKNTNGWMPWDLLLKKRLGRDIGVEKRFITFTMKFCAENGIVPTSVSSGNHSSMGIPPNLWGKYVSEFQKRFSFPVEEIDELLDESDVQDNSQNDTPSTIPSKISIIPSFDQVSEVKLTPVQDDPIVSKIEPPMTRYNT